MIGKKWKGDYFVTIKNYMKFRLNVHRSFYFNLFIGLEIVCSCFWVAMAELSSCNRYPMAHKDLNIYYTVIYRNRLPILAVEVLFTVSHLFSIEVWQCHIGFLNFILFMYLFLAMDVT